MLRPTGSQFDGANGCTQLTLWAATLGGRPPQKRSDFGLFRDLEGVVNLDPQVSHR
jgi:hypothetical protein